MAQMTWAAQADRDSNADKFRGLSEKTIYAYHPPEERGDEVTKQTANATGGTPLTAVEKD